MISIIISHKNRINQLKRCINFLANQKTKYKYEIIIVDGGSRKKDIEILKEYEQNKIIKIYYLNDSTFNVSKYRNYGVKKSNGSIITFLDVDILVPEQFVENIGKKYMNKSKTVIIHTAYGFRIDYQSPLAKDFDAITHKNIDNYVKKMSFSDFRDSAMEYYNENFADCPAPWVYGWSGVISMQKELFIDSGGFDEKFEGWGSEDTDLAYRLWINGGKFVHEKEAYGIHVAHKSNKIKKENQNYLNRKFIYSKYKTFETELYTCLTGVSINNFLNFCKFIHLGALNPIYSIEQITIINEIIENKKSLCVGLDSYQELKRLHFKDYLVLNENAENVIKKANEDVNCIKRLGVMTDYNDKYFDVCIIFDAYNYLSLELYNCVIKEMKRISKKVYQISTKNFEPNTFNKMENSGNKDRNIIPLIL